MATPTYTLRHITLLTVFSFAVFLPLGDSESLRLYKTTTKDGADLWCYPVNCTSPFERCSVNGTHDRCVPCEEGYFFVDNISSDEWRGSSPVCLSKVKECDHECADLAILVNKEECGITERAECACDLTKAFGTDPNLCEEYDGTCDVPNKQLTMNGSCEDCPSGTEKLAANNSRCVPKQTVLSTTQAIINMINGTSLKEETEGDQLPPTTTVDTTTPNKNRTNAGISDTEDGSSLTPVHIALIVGIVVGLFLLGGIIGIGVIVWHWPNGRGNGVPLCMLNTRAASSDPEIQNTHFVDIQAGNGRNRNGQTQVGNGHMASGQAQNGQILNGYVQNRLIPNNHAQNGHFQSSLAQNGVLPNGYQQNGQIPNDQAQNGHLPHSGNDDGQDFGAIVTIYSDEEPQNSGLVSPQPEDLSLTIEGAAGEEEEEEERNTLLRISPDETESGETFAMELL